MNIDSDTSPVRAGGGAKLSLALKGMAMGIAEVIPGVSGGTIAFITGIYEELIHTIKAIGPDAINGYKSGGLSGLWQAINGKFLSVLGVGMAVGIGIGIFGITYLLDTYPQPLWGFFFGLIVASAIIIGREIKRWSPSVIAAFVFGVIVAYGITILSPATGSTHPLYIFLSGMIAISALMLPGISGSFILLLMGMYTIIIPTLKITLRTFDSAGMMIIGIFGAGCLVGLFSFSRVLSWLFHAYKEVTFALLTGFLIGALNKVWPWRNVSDILIKETGETIQVLDYVNFGAIDPETIKVLTESNVLPSQFMMGEPYVVITILCTFAGFIGVLLLDRYQKAA